jgi:hypothetical protein
MMIATVFTEEQRPGWSASGSFMIPHGMPRASRRFIKTQ